MNPLWAITTYFNPTSSRRRLANYRMFRASLAAPLLTVEWSPDGRFELGEGDADVLLQLDGGNTMWQKERLLNLGIARLPASCDYVAWVDCDIVFDSDAWASEAPRRLDDASLVQLYDSVAYLSPTPIDALPRIGEWQACPVDIVRKGGAAVVRDLFDHTDTSPVTTDDPEAFRRMPSMGFAWAARREFLAKHPLFDVWVCGGGDSAYISAATGRAHLVVEQHRLSHRHRDHYLPRARALHSDVAGRIDFVPGAIYHLWHGELRHKRYGARHRILAEHDFDPSTFLHLGRSGVWAWAEVPATLPIAIDEYFRGRHEDGVDAVVA